MRLLLVENDAKVADLVARGLRAERFSLDVATDGITGWELASRELYDVVILDLMLPGMNGTDLLRHLCQSASHPAVLILTARDSARDRLDLLQAGADDYLTKPFALAELLARLRALVLGPRSDSIRTLRVADLELDRHSHQVRRAGQPIELTAREFALLEYLVAHAGQVLSRAMIVQHVWDTAFEHLPGIVDVHVRHLRAKIDDPFPAKLIKTVQGAGYAVCDSLPS